MSDEPVDSPASAWLADALAAHRGDALCQLRDRLVTHVGGFALDPTALDECVSHADEILSELIDAIRHGGRPPAAAPPRTAARIGVRRAAARVRPEESLRASAHVFDVILELIARLEGAESAPVTHASRLNWIITERLRVASPRYSTFLLDEISRAHTSERLRISRELHDRVSNDIGAAIRHLELHDVLHATDPALAREMLDRTSALLARTVEEMRSLTSSLRLVLGEVTFEEAIARHLAEARPAPDHEVRVTGETEVRVPAHLREELFLMIREAMRNVTAHAQATRVIVEVEFSPAEVRATVDDNGVGFTCVPSGHYGIASMQERARLLNGTVEVTSAPGHGTRVALRVPLDLELPDAHVN